VFTVSVGVHADKGCTQRLLSKASPCGAFLPCRLPGSSGETVKLSG